MTKGEEYKFKRDRERLQYSLKDMITLLQWQVWLLLAIAIVLIATFVGAVLYLLVR